MTARKKKQEISGDNVQKAFTVQVCKNCGNSNAGDYCAACGQKFGDLHKPFSELIRDLFSAISFDTSFFRTIPPFLFRPGFLSREFLEGRRKKYMSPVRLYLFLSILFFFIARFAVDPAEGGIITVQSPKDSSQVSIGDSAALEILRNEMAHPEGNAGQADDSHGRRYAPGLYEKLIEVAENPELYYSRLLTNMSYALFLLMPVFALILALLHLRKKHFYIEHLVFSINMHSFALLVLTVITLVEIPFPGISHIVDPMVFVIPVYFTIGMYRFYRPGAGELIWKVIAVAVIYGFLLFATLLGLLILSVALM